MTFRDFLICSILTEKVEDAPLHLVLIVCFMGLLRISNVGIPSVKKFDSTRNTQICDISDEGDAIKVLIKWSKTQQFDVDTLLLPKACSDVICPVKAWRMYRNVYLDKNIDVSLPWLIERFEDTFIPLTIDSIRHKLLCLFERANMGKLRYTPHSLRRGGATFYAENGLPLPAIKRFGKWKSDAIEAYLKEMSQRSSPIFRFIQNL